MIAVLALLLLSLVLALLPALALRGRSRRLTLLAASAASLLLIAWTLWGRDQPWVARIVQGPDLAIAGSWTLPLAALLIGCAWPELPGPLWRRGALAASCLGLAAWAGLGFLLADPPSCSNVWRDGVCLQTTASSCSPAAAATLLAQHGVMLSEAELAADCFSSERGTSLHGLIGGLRRHAPSGSRVRAAALEVEQLREIPLPAIVSVVLSPELDARDPRYARDWGWIVDQPHSVVIEAIDDELIPTVADPAAGRERWHGGALQALWLHRVVWIER